VYPLRDYLLQNDEGIELELIEVDFERLNESLLAPMRRFAGKSSVTGDSAFLITGSTELFNAIEVINQNAGTLPVLSVTPSHVTAGENSALMALGVSFSTNAKLAAEYALQILAGTARPQEMPVGIITEPDISINFRRRLDDNLKVPFRFLEDAVDIYNHQGAPVRLAGKTVNRPGETQVGD
jgi:putative ABC transport system substrate-binding protein